MAHLRFQNRVCLYVASALIGVSTACNAQTFHDCKSFSENLHDAIDCSEALFSETPLHLTFSSMPPGNGFAIGGVLEQNNHYVSPFALPGKSGIVSGKLQPQQPDFSTKSVPSLGSLWSADGRIAAVFSTNGSWLTTGTLTLMPKGYVPRHRTDHNGVQDSCNKLGPLCTRQIFGMHLEATHRSLQTISFYGIGPLSPSVKYIFHQNDTFGSFRAALPLADWLSVESGFEYRQTDLPPSTASNSVSTNFDSTTAPGLSSQPGFAHPYLALRTDPTAYLSPKTDDQEDNHSGPLMKPYLLFTFSNSAEYHWYSAQSDPASSFQQFVVDSKESIQLGTRGSPLRAGCRHQGGNLPAVLFDTRPRLRRLRHRLVQAEGLRDQGSPTLPLWGCRSALSYRSLQNRGQFDGPVLPAADDRRLRYRFAAQPSRLSRLPLPCS